MRRYQSFGFALLALLGIPGAHAASYWLYHYQNIEVIATRARDAKQIAHNLHRVDVAAGKLMRSLDPLRPPTYVYALSASQLHDLVPGDAIGSQFWTNGTDNYVLMDDSLTGSAHFWSAYFGYGGSLLLSSNTLRYPPWFVLGFSELVAGSGVGEKQVVFGGVNPGIAHGLLTGKLLPLQVLLALERGDAQLKSESVRNTYEAECWFLVHQILLDGFHREEFEQYLQLTGQGRDPAEAFAASFKESYDAVDADLHKAIALGSVHTAELPVPDQPDAVEPRRLSDAEAQGRLALLELSQGSSNRREIARRLATKALATEPANEYALRALTLVQLREEQFAAARDSAERLRALPSPSAAAFRDLGRVFSALARPRASQQLTGVDAGALRQQAIADLMHAIQLEGDNPDDWVALLNVLVDTRDPKLAAQYLPRAEQGFYLHAHNAGFAFELARLYAAIGDYDNAFKFAVAWRNNALTVQNRDQAIAFMSRAKMQADLQHAAASASTASPAAPAAPAAATGAK
ncbi:MAG TPA: hypothetical protein VME21_14960 [Steroidobacteraceae bacterium]|nr:hypothetical protein [Steroidobacteraceae bacterium]